MLTLLIDTSTERGVVFIFDEDKLVFNGLLPPGLHNSTDLLPAIADGFKQLGIAAKDLGLIGVGVGPGSYTGLRVAAMAAKALSYAGKIPLVGICTLSVFASCKDEPYAVIIDAKIGGAYLQVPGKEPLVSALADLPAHLEGIATLVSPSCSQLAAKLSQIYPDNQWSWEEVSPNPHVMYRAAMHLHDSGRFTTDGSVELLYMRKTQAEIERDAR